ncbi:flavodoxin family protein [Candidatus Poribacteria bacterium]|nr:flavodoxin family protein [Candidatus Poribacteria bacterium]
MKVLGIAGSPRRGGNTDLLLDEALRGAKEAGAEVEKIYARDYKITPCIECNSCFKLGRCVIEDEMQKVYPKLLEADRIIFASPMFFMGITGWAKALVDRCQALWAKKYVLKEPVVEPERKSQRKGIFISVGGTKGKSLFDGAIRTMKIFFDAIDVTYSGELLYRSIDDKGEIKEHPTALQEAYEAGRKLVCEE